MSLAVAGLSKSFGELQALSRVDLTVGAGELHALLGANGSGKSTLVKCLGGAYQADRGTIELGGTVCPRIETPNEAAELGVRIVHQETPLVATMRVDEYVAMCRGFPDRGRLGRISWRRSRAYARELMERYEIEIDPSIASGALAPAQRALVSLAIALDGVERGVEVLILDEVTAAIPDDEAMEFLSRVRALADGGLTVVMVTHRFKEVMAFADRVTILANGSVVFSGDASSLGSHELVEYMTRSSGGAAQDPGGEDPGLELADLEATWGRPSGSPGRAVLTIQGLYGEVLDDLSFELRAGEVVGVAGMPESGIDELPRILAGVGGEWKGSISSVGGALRPSGGPRRVMEIGIGVVPRDRLNEGGVAALDVLENMTLPNAGRFWNRKREERQAVDRYMGALDVRPRDRRARFGRLSGGNQQKVVISKWLGTEPSVLVLDDPTSGVDPAARRQLLAVLREAARNGLGVLVFSTEPEQLASTCDRVLVLGRGTLVAELSRDELSPDTINQRVITLSSSGPDHPHRAEHANV